MIQSLWLQDIGQAILHADARFRRIGSIDDTLSRAELIAKLVQATKIVADFLYGPYNFKTDTVRGRLRAMLRNEVI